MEKDLIVTLKVKGKYEDIIKGIEEEQYNSFILTKEGEYAILTVKDIISSSKNSEYWNDKPVIKLYTDYSENMKRGHFEVVVDGIRKLNIDIEDSDLLMPSKKLSHKIFKETSYYNLKEKEDEYEQAKRKSVSLDPDENYLFF